MCMQIYLRVVVHVKLEAFFPERCQFAQIFLYFGKIRQIYAQSMHEYVLLMRVGLVIKHTLIRNCLLHCQNYVTKMVCFACSYPP